MKKITLLLLSLIGFSAFAQTVFAPKQVVSATGAGPYRVDSGIINDDEFSDFVVLTVAPTLEVYFNDASGGFGPKTVISNSLTEISDLNLVDLNNDTFLDILVCGGNKVLWFPNDGSGNFTTENEISTNANGAANLAFGMIDDNSTVDVLFSSYDGNQVLWYSNDGNGNFTLGDNLVDDSLTEPTVISLKDVDNDSDLDVLVSTSSVPSGANPLPNSINLFYNNLFGSGTVSFTKELDPIGEDKIFMFSTLFEDQNDSQNSRFFAADFGFGNQGSLYSYEDSGSGYEETMVSSSLLNPSELLILDMDNDNLNDLVAASGSQGSSVNISWFKNNGDGSYAADVAIDNTQRFVYSITSQDFDLDGDFDIVSVSYNDNQVNYFENQLETLSVLELETEKFNIYPNPVNERLQFSATDLNYAQLTITDMTGKTVFNDQVYLEEGLDVSRLNNGVYILTVNQNSNFRFIKM